MAEHQINIWMPIYIGDYLRDTQQLTAEEHGIYLLLLMHYWELKGKIGCDIKRLSIVARSDQEITKYILDTYFSLEDGNYKNIRADEELAAAINRSEAAKANINKRWDSHLHQEILKEGLKYNEQFHLTYSDKENINKYSEEYTRGKFFELVEAYLYDRQNSKKPAGDLKFLFVDNAERLKHDYRLMYDVL